MTRPPSHWLASYARDGARWVLALALLSLPSCASQEAAMARAVAAPHVQCPSGDLAASVRRETPRVREWAVGCDFAYTRVLCSDDGCRRPKPKPICIAGARCVRENPQTLEWELLPVDEPPLAQLPLVVD